jgi:hypothetical protein
MTVMHPLHWVYVNREMLQALSGVIIAVLTIILIVLNTIYVTANWKTMRLMEADVRFRLRPIPQFSLNFEGTPKGYVYTLRIFVRVEHAPMRLVSILLEFFAGA